MIKVGELLTELILSVKLGNRQLCTSLHL